MLQPRSGEFLCCCARSFHFWGNVQCRIRNTINYVSHPAEFQSVTVTKNIGFVWFCMILYMTNFSGFQAALMAEKGVGRSKITTLSLALRPKPVPTRQHSWKMPIEMQIQWVAVELWQHVVGGHESTTNHGIEKTLHF